MNDIFNNTRKVEKNKDNLNYLDSSQKLPDQKKFDTDYGNEETIK